QASFGMQKQCSRCGSGRKIFGGAPLVAWGFGLTDGPHHVITHRRVMLDTVVFAQQIMPKPARHVLVNSPIGVFGVKEFTDTVAFVRSAMQPWADQQLLLAPRVLAAMMLPPLKAGNRALVHKVVPAADRK